LRKRFDFLEVNLTRTGLTPTYLTVENQGHVVLKKISCLKTLMFLYFEILYSFFGVFELFENMCHMMQAIGQTLKYKENYFWHYENECHTVRTTEQTQ